LIRYPCPGGVVGGKIGQVLRGGIEPCPSNASPAD
jgi:hypothetical protein